MNYRELLQRYYVVIGLLQSDKSNLPLQQELSELATKLKEIEASLPYRVRGNFTNYSPR